MQSHSQVSAPFDVGQGLLGIVVLPLDLHLVNVGSIPTGPTHDEKRLQPHPGDELKSTPNVWKSPRSGLKLEGRLSDPQILMWGATMAWEAGETRWEWLIMKISE